MALPQIGTKFQIIKNLRALLEELLGLTFRFGNEPEANFTGSPKQSAVIFSTPFVDATYSIVFGVRSSDNKTIFIPSFTDKTAAGFTLNLNTSNSSGLVEVSWLAMKL